MRCLHVNPPASAPSAPAVHDPGQPHVTLLAASASGTALESMVELGSSRSYGTPTSGLDAMSECFRECVSVQKRS